MASYTAYRAIRDYLDAQWTTTRITWGNDNLGDENTQPWVHADITGTSYEQQSIGAGSVTDNRWVEEGVLFMNVMVHSGQGTDLARSYADTLVNLFRGQDFSQMEFLRFSVGLGEVATENGNWWALPISIEWERG